MHIFCGVVIYNFYGTIITDIVIINIMLLLSYVRTYMHAHYGAARREEQYGIICAQLQCLIENYVWCCHIEVLFCPG